MGSGVIGRGMGFPVKPSAGGTLPFVGGDDKIRQSIRIILETAPGERQMRYEFGCGIHDLVFQANTEALRGLVRERVQDALLRWEPRIDVLDVRVDSSPGVQNHLLIRIDYRVRSNNAFYNFVYPFFINEGADRGVGSAA
jgi:phage baseplate assembly protein W